MFKGQLEFIVVLGVIIVAVVGVLYAVQVIPPIQLPTDIEQEKNLIRDSVSNMIRTGSLDIIKNIGEHGGYLDPPAQSVVFSGKNVPYWQLGGQINIPNIEANFISALTEFIENNKDGIGSSVGRNVTFGSVSITNVRFLDNTIEMDVNMPTTLHLEGNYPIEQPYRISIQTKFGEVKEFAERFVSAQLNERYLEYFTMASILQSEIDNGIQKTPIIIHLTECGEFVFKTWDDIKPNLEFVIESTLSHTYMPGKVPLNIGDTSGFPKYTLPDFNGNEYQDLDVSFDLPDRFELSRESFQMEPEPIIIFADHIQLTSRCQSDPVRINYFLNFPTIVRIRDTLTGNDFRFAIQLFIKDNVPGDFVFGIEDYVPSYQAEICQSLECPVDLMLVGSDGNPLQASVNFMGCYLGMTGSDGILRGNAPCGVGPLEIYKTGYGPLIQMRGSHELVGDLISMQKIPLFTVHFHEVNVNKLPSGSYLINPTAIRELNEIHEEQAVSISFQSPNNTLLCTLGICQWYFNTRTGIINNLPADFYSVTASLLGGFVSNGMILTSFTLSEDMDGKELHVYIPNYLPFKSIQNQTEQILEGEKLTKLLERCDIGPISTQPVEMDVACIKTEGELL